MAKSLVVYFSRRGQNYWNGSIKELARGNTETVAEMIAEAVGADLFEVERTEPYPENYDACTREAQLEAHEKARPALVKYLDSIDAYDTIFVGYPNWWGTMPMPVFAFLERYDFTGKRVAPFCTHEGSGMGASEKDIARLCAGAKVEKGLPIHGGSVASAEPLIRSWLESVSK